MSKSKNLSAGSSIHSPSPGDGEVRSTALPDDFDGIRFEIGRLVRYVQDARRDPLVIDAARLVAAEYSRFAQEMASRQGQTIDIQNNKPLMVEGIDLFLRHHYFYVNDPASIEVIQTPRRMIKETRVAKEVLVGIMEPFYRAMEESDPSFVRASYEPPPMFTGDCEEVVSLFLGMCGALDIVPVRFRFGGTGGRKSVV